ncbi:MAG TPA: O-antigen ligase family protein [Anaeromyxobacter sp.]|nr:O-antigen ligase family protein [Anaeromyxobacter sp.]
MATTDAAALDGALLAREAWVERAGRRWGGLAHAGALAFVAMLYSSPQFWWPALEQLRLAYVSAAVLAGAVVVHRVVSGERIRVGGWPSVLVFSYLAFIPISLVWTVDRHETLRQSVEAWKMAVLFVAVQNAVASPSRLRRFLLVAALASLGPALGGIDVWRTGDALVDGFRTHWRGNYADPNRLAMSVIAVLPFALYGAWTARRRWVRVAFLATVAAQIAVVVLTHSRSGSIGMGVAVLAFLVRGKKGLARAAVASVVLLAALGAFAPETFWQRNATLGSLEEDESVHGRENAWKVLGVIVEERPFTGVGAGAFLHAWSRYAPLSAGGHRYVAHNLLLEIVGDLGVLAFALFAGFAAWALWATWRAGDDPLVGREARAIFAGLAGYLVCEMANGYSMSWYLYFLFACGLAAARMARLRTAHAEGA